jgi:hypothetical protein
MLTRAFGLLAALTLAACSGGGTPTGGAAGAVSATADSGSVCGAGLLGEGGRCVDPLRRFEPATRVDSNNVVSYGGALTLKLPDPPRSGFRLVVPPRTLKPGEEVEDCTAWAYPAIQNKNVYAARVYTTGALHHSNMYGVPLAATGASPYPTCTKGQANLATQIVANVIPHGAIPDVLFANSTQINGGEQIVFPAGMAFKIATEGREVATTIHWLNVSDQEMTSEVVYDFFTMPDDQVTEALVPFVYDNSAFSIPANTEGHITTTCALQKAGTIVSVMPHTHRHTTSFIADLVRPDGTTLSLVNDGAIDGSTQIKVFDQPISMEGFTQVHYDCTVKNDNVPAGPIVYGIGQNEMCTLFGYLYPPSAQQMGTSIGSPNADGSSPACSAVDLGGLRK